MPECCPQSPLYYLYPGRPMEQSFFYTRENIPPIPPITQEMKPQIPHNYPLPFEGAEPQKMAAVEPELRFDSPEEWWNVPRGNFPGETLPKKHDEQDSRRGEQSPLGSQGSFPEESESLPNREDYRNLTKKKTNTQVGVILLLLLIISLMVIR